MQILNNQAAALYLGAAVRKVFPHSIYLGSGVDARGFYAHFQDSEPFQKGFFSLLEEVMHTVFKKENLVEQEMLASNAAELFSHHGEELLAEVLRGSKEIVRVVQIGPYYDLCKTSFEPTEHFTLVEFEQIGQDIRVYGRAFSSKENLKKFTKLWKEYPQKNHLQIAGKLEFYEQKFWHPRGIQFVHILQNQWRKFLLKYGYEEVGFVDAREYFAFSGRSKFCFWSNHKDDIFSFSDKTPNSPLQIIEKWIKIFDFEAEWVLPASSKKLARALSECKISYIEENAQAISGFSRAEVRIADRIGRFWTCSTLDWHKDHIIFSLCGDIARFVALLLEKTEGDLPFWMCPEQIRVLPIGEANSQKLEEVLLLAGIRFTVDRKESPLKEKVHRALHVKVPYVMVFGKKEKEQEIVKIRAYGSDHEKTMTLDQLKNFLAEQTLESQ